MKRLAPSVATLICIPLLSAHTHADPQYANSVIAGGFLTFFGSGIVTGAPDNGGVFLSTTLDPPQNQGFITLRFTTPLFDGPGNDLTVIDIANHVEETVSVELSANGSGFTLVGTMNAVENTLDVNGGFPGTFSFVRLTNTSLTRSIDIDAVAGFHSIPEPALFAAWPLLLYQRRRRRTDIANAVIAARAPDSGTPRAAGASD